MKTLLLASLLAVSASAQSAPKLLAPNEENGAPINYRMVRLEVPAGTAARIQVSLAPSGECFDTSIISWTKELVEGKRFQVLNFDAAVATVNGKKPEGCPRRKVNHGGLHTVDLPAEKGGMQVLITYREGEEVRATYAKSFKNDGVPGSMGVRPTRVR